MCVRKFWQLLKDSDKTLERTAPSDHRLRDSVSSHHPAWKASGFLGHWLRTQKDHALVVEKFSPKINAALDLPKIP
jgi:hypothetical protein